MPNCWCLDFEQDNTFPKWSTAPLWAVHQSPGHNDWSLDQFLKGLTLSPVKSGSLTCNLKMPTWKGKTLHNYKPSIFGLERFNFGGCMSISAPWRVLCNSFHPKVPRALHRLTLSKSRSNSRAPAVGSFSAEAPKLEMPAVKWDAKWRIYFGSSIFALYIMLDIISCHIYISNRMIVASRI